MEDATGYILFVISAFLFTVHGISVKTIPAYGVTLTAGQDLYLRIVEPINELQNCTITTTKGEIPLLQVNGTQGTTGYEYFGAGFDSGECGVKASNLVKEDSETWSIKAGNSSGVYEGKLQVKVQDGQQWNDTGSALVLGEHGTIALGPLQSVFCQMRHPTGKYIDKWSGPCRKELITVKKEDAGIWSAVYYLPGSVEQISTSAEFTVIEKQISGLKTTVQSSASVPGAIDMLCRLVKSSSRVKCSYCYFEHPNGTGFLMQEGIGKGEYAYFGEGLDNDYMDCGLTIFTPSEEDYGMWKCELGLTETLQVRDGGYIFLQKTNEDKFPILKATAYSDQTMVLNNTESKLGCTVPYIIKACWLKNPKGEILTVNPDKIDNKKFSYAGDSFGLGHCLISITLYMEDAGQWQCNMALDGSDGGDISVAFSVHVKENELTVDRNIIEAAEGENTLLYCHSTIHQYPLETCRFIRPDGQGFTLNGDSRSIQGRYIYYGNGLDAGDCGLRITSIKAADFGQWSCSAFLHGASEANTEHIAIHHKAISGGAVAAISVGAVVAVALIAAYGCFLIYRRRQAHHSQAAVYYQDDTSSQDSHTS